MLITDAQIHVWEANRPDRPWPAGRAKLHAPEAFTAEQAIAAMDEAGVDRAVIVPPSWIGEDNISVMEAVERYPGRFGIMGRFDPKQPDALDRIETWRKQPGMLGIRLTLAHPLSASWLTDGTLDNFWATCEWFGVPVMLSVAGQLQRLPVIAGRHPRLNLIVDHMGIPEGAKGPAAFNHLGTLETLVRYPNVAVKVTSLPSYSLEDFPYRGLHPHIRRVYDAFGPQRMLWGSDLTRLKGTYCECLDLFREALDFLTDEDRNWILGRAAAERLRWPEPSN